MGFHCSEACGIFPDQELNLCPLHWQADSLPQSDRQRLLNGSFSDIEFYYFLLANRDAMVLKQIIVT